MGASRDESSRSSFAELEFDDDTPLMPLAMESFARVFGLAEKRRNKLPIAEFEQKQSKNQMIDPRPTQGATSRMAVAPNRR